MDFQEFCFNNETLRFPVHTDPVTAQTYSRLDDLQDIFPHVQRVMLDGIIVPFMVDGNQQKYEPKRIPHIPGKVLHLLAPTNNTTLTLDPPACAPPEYTPDNRDLPSYGQASSSSTPAASANPPRTTAAPSTTTLTPMPQQQQKKKPPSVASNKTGSSSSSSSSQNNSYDGFLTSFELYQQPIPRLFVILPGQDLEPIPQQRDVGRTQFRLYFLCEHAHADQGRWTTSLPDDIDPLPEDVHLTTHQGYEIQDWDLFLENYGLYVLSLLLHLTHRLEATPYVTPFYQDVDLVDNNISPGHPRQQTLERIRQAIAYLEPCVSPGGRNLIPGAENNPLRHWKLNQLPMLLGLHRARGLFGGLSRQATNGQVRWVCLQHQLDMSATSPGLQELVSQQLPKTEWHHERRLRRLTLTVSDAKKMGSLLRQVVVVGGSSCLDEIELKLTYPCAMADLKRLRNAFRNAVSSVQSVIVHSPWEKSVGGTGTFKSFLSRALATASTSSTTSPSSDAHLQLFFSTAISTSTGNTCELALRSVRLDGFGPEVSLSDLRAICGKSLRHLRAFSMLSSSNPLTLDSDPQQQQQQHQPPLPLPPNLIAQWTFLRELCLGSIARPGKKLEENDITKASASFWRGLKSLRRLERLELYLIQLVHTTPQSLLDFRQACSGPNLRQLTLVLYDSFEALVSLGGPADSFCPLTATTTATLLGHLEVVSLQSVAAWRCGYLMEPMTLTMAEPHQYSRAIEYDMPTPRGLERQRDQVRRLTLLLKQHAWTHFGCNMAMEWTTTSTMAVWGLPEMLLAHVHALGDMRRLCSVRWTRAPTEVHRRFWELYFGDGHERLSSSSIKAVGGGGHVAMDGDDNKGAGAVSLLQQQWRQQGQEMTRPLRYLVLAETSIPKALLDHLGQVQLKRLSLHYCMIENSIDRPRLEPPLDEGSSTLSPPSWTATLFQRLCFERLQLLLIRGVTLGESGIEAWMMRKGDFRQDLEAYLCDMAMALEDQARMQAAAVIVPRMDNCSVGQTVGSSSSSSGWGQWLLRNQESYDRQEFVEFYNSFFFASKPAKR